MAEVDGWRWVAGGGVVVHVAGRLLQRGLEAWWPAEVERALAAAPDRALLRRDFMLYHSSTLTSLGMFLWSAALSARMVVVGVRARGLRGFLCAPPLDDAYTVRNTRRMLFVLGGHLRQDFFCCMPPSSATATTWGAKTSRRRCPLPRWAWASPRAPRGPGRRPPRTALARTAS